MFLTEGFSTALFYTLEMLRRSITYFGDIAAVKLFFFLNDNYSFAFKSPSILHTDSGFGQISPLHFILAIKKSPIYTDTFFQKSILKGFTSFLK